MRSSTKSSPSTCRLLLQRYVPPSFAFCFCLEGIRCITTIVNPEKRAPPKMYHMPADFAQMWCLLPSSHVTKTCYWTAACMVRPIFSCNETCYWTAACMVRPITNGIAATTRHLGYSGYPTAARDTCNRSSYDLPGTDRAEGRGSPC